MEPFCKTIFLKTKIWLSTITLRMVKLLLYDHYTNGSLQVQIPAKYACSVSEWSCILSCIVWTEIVFLKRSKITSLDEKCFHFKTKIHQCIFMNHRTLLLNTLTRQQHLKQHSLFIFLLLFFLNFIFVFPLPRIQYMMLKTVLKMMYSHVNNDISIFVPM